MAHLLFRPHIDHGDKLVTTDFVIRTLDFIDAEGNAIAIPIDLANCAVDLEAHPKTALIAPVIFVFAGDTDLYAAPAIAVLDGEIYAQDEQLAWRNARTSIGRAAIPLADQPTIGIDFQDERALPISNERLTGAGRQKAALHSCGEIRKMWAPAQLHLAITSKTSAEHRLSLTALQVEQAS